MPKVSGTFNLDGYAPVAERITLFYDRYPEGRILTELISRVDGEVTFKACVYRTMADRKPSATGWASEREEDGEINLVACLENTETSAIGRALANLGLAASRYRPSAEEMLKASRVRVRLARREAARTSEQPARAVAEPVRSSYPTSSSPTARPLALDLLHLLGAAELAGLRPARAHRWRELLKRGSYPDSLLERCERRLRIWLSRREL
ncbi:MAG: hypothetical protein ACR2OG_00940 [Gemmatimonadaceae bacterium]